MFATPDNMKMLVKKNVKLIGDGLDDCRSKIYYIEDIEEEKGKLKKEEEDKHRKEEENKKVKEGEEGNKTYVTKIKYSEEKLRRTCFLRFVK